VVRVYEQRGVAPRGASRHLATDRGNRPDGVERGARTVAVGVRELDLGPFEIRTFKLRGGRVAVPEKKKGWLYLGGV